MQFILETYTGNGGKSDVFVHRAQFVRTGNSNTRSYERGSVSVFPKTSNFYPLFYPLLV